MYAQPGLCLFHRWRSSPDDAPEGWRVIWFNEVGKFMNDDVIDNEHRCLDQSPVEVDLVAYGASAPAIPIFDDSGAFKRDTQFLRMLLDASENLLVSLADVPVAQDFAPPRLTGGRHEEHF